MKRASEKILITGLIMVVCVIVTIVFISYQLSKKVHDTDVLITHTTDVQFHIQKILSGTIENETSARGYALSGLEKFLEPLEKSEIEITSNVAELKEHSAFHPSQQASIDSLQVYTQKRIANSRKLISLRKEQGLEAAAKLTETETGKFYTDQIRLITSTFMAEERSLMEGQRTANSSDIIYLNDILLGLAALIFILLVLVFILVRKSVITQKQSEQLLKEANTALDKDIKAKNEQLAHIFERITDAFAAVDSNWRFTYVNKKAGEILNAPPGKLIGNKIWSIFPNHEISNRPFIDAFQIAMDKQEDAYMQQYYPPFDRWVELHIYPSHDGISVFFGDITEKKKAEEKILKANRLYNFISEVNQMIVHAVDANSIFENVCNIAVAQGQFKMAWIGLVDEQTQDVIPVMFSGHEDGYLSRMSKIKIPNVTEGQGPTGTAVREGKYIICNDIENDPHMAPWKDEALSRGYQSSIAVPISKFGKVIGTFNVYAAEKQFFDTEETTLVLEAAEDISFGMEIIENKKLRQQSEDLLREERDKFVKIAETSPGLIYSFRRSSQGSFFNFPYAGKNIEDIFGFTKSQLEEDANIITPYFHPDDSTRITESIETSAAMMAPWKCEFRYLHPAKGEIWLEGHTIPKQEADDSIIWYGVITDSTERKKAEQELYNSNFRFEMISRATNDALWEWNFETGILWGNENHQRLYGLTMADQVPDNAMWLQRIHPDDRHIITETQTRSLVTDKSIFVSEYRFLNADNEYRNIFDRCYILRDSQLNPVSMLGSMMDITEQKKAEQKIIDSEKRFRNSLDKMLEGVQIISFDWKYLYVNETAAQHGNTTREALEGFTMLEKYPGIEQTLLFKTLQKCMLERKPHFLINSFTYPDATNAWFELSIQPVPEGLFILSIDITEKKEKEKEIKQAEETIKKSEEQYRYLFNYSPMPKWIYDIENFKILDVNEAAIKHYGYSKEQLTVMTIKDIRPAEDLEKFLKIDHHTAASAAFNAGEWRHKKADGSIIYVEISGHPIEYNGRSAMMIISNDITERKKSEDIIKQINNELHDLSAHLQTIREEERLQIARDIHDELGQQLTGLKLGIEWLSLKIATKDTLLKEKIDEMVSLIKVTIQSVRRISSNLRPSMLDDLGLVAALEWQSQEIQKRSGINVFFNSPIQEPELPIETSTALFRIYQEALTNVVRHAAASEIKSSLQIVDDTLILEVSDDGIGMDTEKNASPKSFGIIGIKERTFAIGGKFYLQSQPRNGTTIKITVHI